MRPSLRRCEVSRAAPPLRACRIGARWGLVRQQLPGVMVVLGIAAGAVPAWAACEAKPGATRVQGRDSVVLFQPRPAPIKVGVLFALDFDVCAQRGEVRQVGVDATMPEHRHGMNYLPVVKKGAVLGWSATGLMFHMPGRWQLVFDVDTGTGRERVLHNLTVE